MNTRKRRVEEEDSRISAMSREVKAKENFGQRAVSELAFGLLKVRGLKEENHNSGMLGLSLNDVFSGDIKKAIICNFLIDINWLISQCPQLKLIPHVFLFYDPTYKSSITQALKLNGCKNFIAFCPRLPILYGTHHSKAFLLFYERGVRVVIHTANLISIDWDQKNQGFWYQDFPLKSEEKCGCFTSDFESDLVDYFKAYKMNADMEKEIFLSIMKHEYYNARVKLISSVPGYYNMLNAKRYGHMRLANILKEETFDSKFKGAPVICQYSSLGSIQEKWLYDEFVESLSGGRAEGEELGPPEKSEKGVQLIWPTVEEVRDSLEGWQAGMSIMGDARNVCKDFLIKIYHRYGGGVVGRSKAMPHIKTYTRYARDGDLAWVLLTSHNLSKAAWGTLQKNKTQMMIRSFELGVLFLPSLEKKYLRSPYKNFICTNSKLRSQFFETGCTTEIFDNGQLQDSPVTLRAIENIDEYIKNVNNNESISNIVYFPLPYKLSPKCYTESDEPWVMDKCHDGKDSNEQIYF